jgi:hypothetical protein
MKRRNITPWQVGEQAPYLTISTAQVFLIGNSTLLIVCLGSRIDLCKDLSNELDHTDGVWDGQPVVWINGIVRGGRRLSMACTVVLTIATA